MIGGMPATVTQHKTVIAPAQKKRSGLIPMAPHSQHVLTVRIGDEEKAIACVARPREDVPRAKTRILCLHERCAGKSWETTDAMHDAHPQRSQMERAQEAHVYGLWSDDPHDPKAKRIADEALAAAERLLVNAKEKDKPGAEFAVEQARAEVAKVAGVIGLIAPAEMRGEG